MQNTVYFVNLVVLVIGAALGALLVHLRLQKALQAAESARDRVAVEAEAARKVSQEKLDDRDRTLAERFSELSAAKDSLETLRRETKAEIDGLQTKLREAAGKAETAEVLKNQLDLKTEEAEAYIQRITRLNSEVATLKAAAEAAVQAKDDAIRTKDAELARLNAAKDAAIGERLKALQDHCDAQLREKDRHIEEQRRLLAEAEKKLAETFDSLSVKALSTISEEFLKTAKATLEGAQSEAKGDLKLKQQAIEELLKPFSETMKALDKRCQEMEEKSAAGDAVLKDQLERLMGATDSLSSAFRRPNARGNWGEATMKNVFEQSGLQEGHDYVLQHTTDAEDGKLRADAIVNLPKGRRLVVDAKNLWDGYQQAMSATEEPIRQALLQKHALAVRNQMKLLCSKAYWQQYEGLDCVVMFLPTEAMYQAALEYDKDLLNDAIANRVYMASPMTLAGLLRTVYYVLDQERLSKNAIEMGAIGRKLHDALRAFGEHHAAVGTQLTKTVTAYNRSVGSLERNVLSKARQLGEKGVTIAAELPDLAVVETLPVALSHRDLMVALPTPDLDDLRTEPN